MPLIGLVHSTRLVIDPVQQVVAAQCPAGTEFVHVMDEGILRQLTVSGRITAGIVQWLADMVRSTEKIGADLTVVSCSSLSPCVGEVRRQVKIPVLKIDEPMMEYAVENAERVGLVMTNPTTEKPSRLLFDEVLTRAGKKATLVPRLCPEAFNKLNRGDVAGHDAEVVETVNSLLEEVDLVLLAQISIMRVRQQMNEPVRRRVFSSLDFIAPKINDWLAAR